MRNSKEKNKTYIREVFSKYQQPHMGRSIWQMVNSFVPYFLLVVAMYFSLNISIWLTLLLAIPTAGFLVRIFIIFHDCTHGSFFKSKKLRTIVGYISGIITFAPYRQWQKSHSMHHTTTGDLDRRGMGDVWTLTVNEYLAESRWKRFLYRVYRNPIIMFGFGPLYLFLIGNRIPLPGTKTQEKKSVYLTNLALISIIALMTYLIGFKAYLLIQLPIIFFGTTAGVWLFYVQHQFEDAYWERGDTWDFEAAALQGSSYYELPAILRWFTGNIGFHHIHHLNARIPNYYLKKCHDEMVKREEIKSITLLSSLKSLNCRLWDEDQYKLVSFSYLKKLRTT